MQFIRKTAVGLMASFLLTCLLSFGLLFGLLRVFGTPNAIEGALKTSGIYQTVVINALDKAQKDQQQQPVNQQPGSNNKESDSIPLDDPAIRTVIQNAASPAYLQAQVERTLNSSYAWLQGKTPKLDLGIDVNDIRLRLGNGLEQYAQQHLATLPTCTAKDIQNQNGDIDPLQATCLPKGADVNQVAAKAKDKIMTGDFIKDTQISADSIKVGKDGKTLSEQTSNVPAIYKNVVWSIYAFGVLALLLGTGVYFLSATRRSGLKKVAGLSIAVGFILTLLGWGISFVVQRASSTVKHDDPLQASVLKVVQLLANDVREWWMGYGILLLVLGIGTLIALHFVKKEGEGEKPTKTDEVVELKDDAPGENEQYVNKLEKSAMPKPRPRPSKKLVQ